MKQINYNDINQSKVIKSGFVGYVHESPMDCNYFGEFFDVLDGFHSGFDDDSVFNCQNFYPFNSEESLKKSYVEHGYPDSITIYKCLVTNKEYALKKV